MIKVSVADRTPISVRVGKGAGARVSVPPMRVVTVEAEKYPGPYEITPTDQMQVYDTQRLMMTRKLVIGPIPSNYGKITWDGNCLTIT